MWVGRWVSCGPSDHWSDYRSGVASGSASAMEIVPVIESRTCGVERIAGPRRGSWAHPRVGRFRPSCFAGVRRGNERAADNSASMKKLILLLCICQAAFAQDHTAKPETPERHEFVISN